MCWIEMPRLEAPDQQLATDVFRAVVDPFGAGFATPLNDTVQAADDPFGWQREVDLDAQPLCASVYLLVFIRNLLVHLAEKILLMQPLTFGGNYRRSSQALRSASFTI